jgi:hypothetical protein
MRNKSYKKRVKNIERNRKTRVNKKTRGGRAIDAGSYGCVFNPPLKCADESIQYNPNNISKLMYKKDAYSEMEEMKKVEQFVKKIPNNDKYFIVANTTNCIPGLITNKEDLISFDKKCDLFTKHGIDSYNVNDQLSKLELINMPNGGLSIDNFVLEFVNMSNKYSTFIKLNNALITLLNNGIVPINKMGFNHYDVKAANILFSSDGNARLIDWGLAGGNDGITVPEVIKDRSIAFNMPFSDILFNSYIKKWLPEELKRIKASPMFKNKNDGQAELLKVIAVNLINKSIQETNEGHYDYLIRHILHDIYKIYADRNSYNKLDYNVLTYNVLIDYIQAVLVKFVDENGNFDDVRYFYEVFAHNVDIWGFILAYAPIIEDGYGILHKDIINGLCRIFLKYCLSPEFATKPIVVSELTDELSSLNNIAKSMPNSIAPIKSKLTLKNISRMPNKMGMPPAKKMAMPVEKKMSSFDISLSTKI